MIIPPAMFMVMEGAMAPWFPRRRVQSGGGEGVFFSPRFAPKRCDKLKSHAKSVEKMLFRRSSWTERGKKWVKSGMTIFRKSYFVGFL